MGLCKDGYFEELFKDLGITNIKVIKMEVKEENINYTQEKIRLDKRKIEELFYEIEDEEFNEIETFYAIKEEEHIPLYDDFDYTIIAKLKNGKEINWADYELTKELVEKFKSE